MPNFIRRNEGAIITGLITLIFALGIWVIRVEASQASTEQWKDTTNDQLDRIEKKISDIDEYLRGGETRINP